MKTIMGWWFAKEDKRLANGDGRRIKVGKTHKIKGEIIPCRHGLHLSPKILDALRYAPGPILYKVQGSGTIIPHGNPIDKYACSERTYLAGGIDISEMLYKFARMCALDVIHLWDAPDVVISFLKTGKEELQDAAIAAQDAAIAAQDVAIAAWYAGSAAQDAGSAARYTADAAWDAANAAQDAAIAARYAANAAWYAANAAWYAADDARNAAIAAQDAGSAAWYAANAAQTKQNKRLIGMINRVI